MERSRDVDDLIELSRLLVSAAYRSLEASPVPVALPQFRALVALSRYGSMTVGALAECLDVTPSTATRLCDKLVTAAWSRRTIPDENRRQVQVHLTEGGRRLVEQVLNARAAELETMLSRLHPQSRRSLAAVLPELLGAADEINGKVRASWAV